MASIPPVGSTSPSGNTPEVAATAKEFEAELSSLTSALHSLRQPVDPQLHNVAQHIIAAHQNAQKALSIGR